MRIKTSPFSKSGGNKSDFSPVQTDDFSRLIDTWILAGDIASHSQRTMNNRRERVGRLLWYLQHQELPECGLPELRQFFRYMQHSHKEPGGRWGNAKETKPLSTGTIHSYHSSIRTFFNFLVAEGEIDVSPMERIPAPVDRPDPVQPFTHDQLKRLLAAARKTTTPVRDETILLVLLDTGVRASELCALNIADVSLQQGQITVLHGKGGKARYLPFSRDVKKLLYNYLRERGEEYTDVPLFPSSRGQDAGARLTKEGLLHLMRRLELASGIDGVRCSPHTFRHTFAIEFLRSGGDVFTLKTLLGHESLAMVNRYVAIAQADLERQHRMHSPVARLKGKGK